MELRPGRPEEGAGDPVQQVSGQPMRYADALTALKYGNAPLSRLPNVRLAGDPSRPHWVYPSPPLGQAGGSAGD